MKTKLKILSTAALLVLVSSLTFAENSSTSALVDTNQIRAQYSLFSEYFKNQDYKSAEPYGWTVLEMDPKMFNKWIYDKMEKTLWMLHDSVDVSEEKVQAIEDTINHFYNLAIENYPEEKAIFQARKAFINQTWLDTETDSLIVMYEKAAEFNKDMDPYYYDRLGELYIKKADDPEFKQKALDLYTYLSEREPDNPLWGQKLEGLVENMDELVDLTKKAWNLDKDNAAKAWKFASLAMKANRYQEAIEALEFLTQKSPDAVNYWNRLGEAYQKTEQLDNAEETYKKLIQLEPDNKNHYYNLGLLYKEKGQLSAARTQLEKASDVGGGWGQPIYIIGTLYEQAARNCAYDFDAKLVYQLAVDTYRRARNMDQAIASEAQQRISALSGSIPTQEDYFFRGLKSGQTIPITGSCYGWIGKSVTVP